MVKKSIAAALLVVMVVWVEVALAPMLPMHLWGEHAAPAMTASMPAHHHHGGSAEHACCPKVSHTENAPPVEFAASSLPCMDAHRCCFLQGPQNPPTPVKAGDGISQDMAPAEMAEVRPVSGESQGFSVTRVAPGPPPGLLGMVLRV
jgi:hypothetical protein